MSPADEFVDSFGETMKYIDFYRKKWGMEIRNREQPLLLCRSRYQNCYIVPELCFRTGLSDVERKDFMLMRELAQITNKNP